MAKINGKCIPTRKTIGAVGDIYIDSSTGKQYKCTFAFKSDIEGDFDCEWKELESTKVEPKRDLSKNDISEKKKVEKPIGKTHEEKSENESTPTEKQTAKVEKSAEEENVKTEEPKRKDYSAYSKKNK